MLTIGIKDAEKFVSQQKRIGNDVRWDNYDIVFFRPDERAMYSKAGRFRSGQWGFENRFPVTSAGTWEIDYRNVKKVRHNRPR